MKILIGKIISTSKMNKTVIVSVSKYKKHLLYKKYIIKTKKYYVHDEFNLSNENDFVEIAYVRPISKLKFCKIIKFLH